MVDDIFSFIRTWDPGLFKEKFYSEAARALGWEGFPELVEREMIFYDTIYAFSMLEDAVFVGGSMLNRVYIKEAPRFSFDIYSVWIVRTTKRELLKELLYLNTRLAERGMYHDLLLMRLGEFQVDVEKDVFPHILSLKRVMPARLVGTPLPLYLKTRLGMDRPGISKAILKVKDELGYVPKVEEVRIEVGLYGFQGRYKEMRVPSLLEGYVKPRLRPAVKCSSLEVSMAKKLKEMEVYEELKLPDLIRDLCDLRALSDLDGLPKGIDVEAVLKTIKKVRAEGREIYEGSWHFQEVRERYSFDELCSEVESSLLKLYRPNDRLSDRSKRPTSKRPPEI